MRERIIAAPIKLPDGTHLKPTLSPMRRELMHAAMDNDTELAGLMHCLHQYKNCDSILRWLISRRYYGKALRELLLVRFRGSVQAMVEYVVEDSKGRETYASR